MSRTTAPMLAECLDASMDVDGSDYPPMTYCGEPITIEPGQHGATCPRCGCYWAASALRPNRGYQRTGDELRNAGFKPASPKARRV